MIRGGAMTTSTDTRLEPEIGADRTRMSLLSKDRIVARPGFNRWWMLPAALLINLSVGQAYAFSVFNLPLSRAIGITESTAADWKLTTLGWIFTLAYVFLGLSAGFGAAWLERVGPRKSGFVAAICWGSGFLISAVGVWVHQVWLLYIGYGIIGGCGLGIGFTTPIATLIRWFPDRRGMATGMAVMGFGGGAIIAAPLSAVLMNRFSTATSVGVAETFVVLGIMYLAMMLTGAFMLRLPPPGWQPKGWADAPHKAILVTTHHVHISKATTTPQFRLMWFILLLNVTAGLGVLGQASAMIQEVFGGGMSAAGAAAFVGLLSFFNMGGRLFWASLSDVIGRKVTFGLFLGVGPILFALVPLTGELGSVVWFVACFAVILTMYGGGFATMPAYVADVFGTQYVGAIHGRVLTALSVAGVLGPVLVNYIREYQISMGVPKADAYNLTMFIMAGLLVIGFFINLAMKPVPKAYHMTQAELAAEGVTDAVQAPQGSDPTTPAPEHDPSKPYSPQGRGDARSRLRSAPDYAFQLGKPARRRRRT